MNISFYGAAREVTGSCYLIQTSRARILVDCGLFQGSAFTDAKNFQDFLFDPSTIDAVLVTHAHLDHVGRIPKLVKEKFRGKIYSTLPTNDIARIVLEDAEQVMEDEFRREYRPKLYEREDIRRTLELFTPVEYGKRLALADLGVTYHDAGHIFGSAFIEVEERGGPCAVFSGDLGNVGMPILRETERFSNCDVAIIESTYGNRLHEDESTRKSKLREVAAKTIKQNGVLVIPAFAVERTQDLLYELNDLIEEHSLSRVDVYLDSPMAISVSEVIRKYPQYYDDEANRHLAHGDDLFAFPGLHLTRSREESKTINDAARPKVIIAGAGMMNGGRIRHHLVRYLSDARSTVLIIGFQAAGTLGRLLYSGEKRVNVLGERVEVRASVVSIGAYSAHADQAKLLAWIRDGVAPPERVFCTHGEEAASAALASRINEEFGVKADCPRFGDTVQL